MDYSPCPHFNLDDEYLVQKTVIGSIEKGLLRSCHDISEGGLFISLLESSMNSGLGVDIQTNRQERMDAYLFGESQSRIVVSVSENDVEAFEAHIKSDNVHFRKLGSVSGNRICINDDDFGSVESYKEIYDTAIEKLLLG